MSNKTALITGSSKRIGKDIAVYLASEGYDIAIHYNSSFDEALKTSKDIKEAYGVECKLFQADFSIGGATRNLVAKVVEEFGGLSLLVNCASVFERSPMLETSPEFFDKMFKINFKAPYFLTKNFAEVCKKEGNVINIIDTKATTNQYVYSAYTLAKKMLAEFTKMAAYELAPKIRVNGISPGFILPPEGTDDDYSEKLIKRVPLDKQGDTKNVVDTVKFILENNFLTGQIIAVDGGESLR